MSSPCCWLMAGMVLHLVADLGAKFQRLGIPHQADAAPIGGRFQCPAVNSATTHRLEMCRFDVCDPWSVTRVLQDAQGPSIKFMHHSSLNLGFFRLYRTAPCNVTLLLCYAVRLAPATPTRSL